MSTRVFFFFKEPVTLWTIYKKVIPPVQTEGILIRSFSPMIKHPEFFYLCLNLYPKTSPVLRVKIQHPYISAYIINEQMNNLPVCLHISYHNISCKPQRRNSRGSIYTIVSSSLGKWNQHLNKAGQQKEAWSTLKSPELLPEGITASGNLKCSANSLDLSVTCSAGSVLCLF